LRILSNESWKKAASRHEWALTRMSSNPADLHVPQVSRLILNLLEANCPLDKSIHSSAMETLKFCHSESNSESEADIWRGDRGATSVGEEVHKEAR